MDDESDPGSEGGEEIPTDPEPTPAGAIPFACPGGTLQPGLNTLVVNGTSRTFYADFPTDQTKPMGVVFSWHGFGQVAANFRTEVALDPNTNPERPVVIVTPNSTGLLPPAGLGWDIREQATNVDLSLFEAALGCLAAQYTIDPAAIYSFGFSAGSVMTSMLHAAYPKLVTTVVAESGAWFNDPNQVKLVTIPLDWQWGPLDPADHGTVLLTHGGPNDVTVLNIMNLEAAAQAALPFLKAHSRTVVDCAHTQGHTLAPQLSPAMIVNFLTAHRTGEPAPDPATSLVAFPASCTLKLP